MEQTYEQLKEENAKLKDIVQEALNKLNAIHTEATNGIAKLNKDNEGRYNNMSNVFDVDLSYMLNVGRYAWAYRAKQIAVYELKPILNKALK